MGSILQRVNAWRRKHTWSLLVVWVGVLVWFGVTTWLQVARQHQEVKELENRLVELDRWNVAGLWLARSVAAREARIQDRWNDLFPVERQREELFLDLARIADESGVQGFELSEKELSVVAVTSTTDMAETEELAPVDSYRIQARFLGRYQEVARFLGGLNGIERAVSLHNLSIMPSRGDIQVELELDVYVSKSNQS